MLYDKRIRNMYCAKKGFINANQSVVTRDRYMRSQMVRLNITKPFRTLDFQLIIKDFCKLWINGLGRMLYITVLYWT